MWTSPTEPWTSFDRIHVIQFLKSIGQYRVTFIKGKGKSRLIFPRISKGHWDNKESLISFLSSSTVSFRFEKNLLVCYPYPLSFSFFVFLECCLVNRFQHVAWQLYYRVRPLFDFLQLYTQHLSDTHQSVIPTPAMMQQHVCCTFAIEISDI